jgi:methionyl-tRNA formyltransferase
MASKVIFLGSKPIGYFCFEHLLTHQKEYNIEIIGLLTNNTNRMGKADLTELAKQHNITVFQSLDDITNLKCDFLISVQYHQILKKEHLSIASRMPINLHMAPLPEYRGCNQFTFAILDAKEEFGSTLHIMDEGIDSGDILAEERFLIPPNCFVNELYELTLEASKHLFETKIREILSGKVKPIPQDSLLSERTTSTHYRKEIASVKKIDLNWKEEKVWRHVRATSMPGFAPPYAEVNGVKLNITVEK